MNLDELWTALEEALLPLEGDHVAIEVDHLIQWTGIQLLALTHHLAALLNKKSSRDHSQQQQVVGIYLENSATYIGAVLAAVCSGAAFLPLDPRWPEKKLLNTLENFRPGYIFYAEENSGVAGACGAPPPFNLGAAQTTLASISADLIASARQITTRKALEESIQTFYSTYGDTISSNIAYIMTTSGSTSSSFASPTATATVTATATTAPSPLGVCGTALGIYKRIKWMAATYPFQKGDIVAFKTNPCFVDSIWEIFAPLLSCGTAVILAIPFSIIVNPYSLLDVLLQYKVTHLTAVPSYWQQLVNASNTKSQGEEKKKLTTLRQVVSSGEQLPWHLLHGLHARLLPTGCRILNLYGTTEVAADATVLDCSIFIEKQKKKRADDDDVDLKKMNSAAAATAMVPVGLPLDEDVIIVLAKLVEDGEDSTKIELIKVCPGAVGEVLIGGWGVAAGYYNRVLSSRNSSDGDVLLGDKFVYLEHEYAVKYCIVGSASTEGEKRSEKNLFFRSGDMGSIDDQGLLCILGRKDLQVKINGVRVDLLEVEAGVKQHHAVHAVAVKMWSAGEEKKRTLGVYLELKDEFSSNDDAIFWNDLRKELVNSLCGSILNSSEIDFYFERMVKLPRSSGGKVDRSSLQLAGDINILSESPHNNWVKRMKITSSELSEIEVHLAFAAALGHHNFEPTSDLFSVLGGTSLTAASIAGMLDIEVEKIFQNPTVRSLSFSSSSSSKTALQQQRREQSLGNILAEDLLDIPELQVVWKAKMKDCVDARPLFYPFPQKQTYSKSSEAADDDERAAAVVFGASHGGDVSCFNASTGAVVWSINIPNEQPDPGMVVIDSFESEKKKTALAVAPSRRKMLLLAVGLNSGSIKFLDATSTGEEVFEDNCINISGMRAAPAVDELKERKDLLWAAGHGKKLLAINNAAQIVATLPLPAAVSAEILVKESLVYVACLDGTLMAVEKKENVNKAPMTTAAELSVLWRHSCKSPIFATPTVVKATDSPSELVVVVVTASGAVMAVDAENGNELWHRVIDPGGYYIPAVYFENSGSILLGSHSGQLTWIGVADGSIKGSYLVEGGGITGMVVLPSNICYGAKESVVFYVIISTVDGQILVLNCSSKEESRDVTSVNVAGRFQLPAASFSGFSYGVIGGMKVIYVGCRDDHLYCLVLP